MFGKKSQEETDAAGLSQAPPCPGGFLHTVVRGDTLYNLARRYQTTVEEIMEANPGIDPNRLMVGQQICIPVAPTPPVCPGGTLYTIKIGDTLFRLAERFGLTVEDILSANPGLDPERLRVGQEICIPSRPPGFCPGGVLHRVRPGDTLFRLAEQYNVTVNEILRANPGLDPERLRVGQEICIPRPAPPSPRRRRCLILTPGELTPRADGVAMIDFVREIVLVAVANVPDPRDLQGDLYRLWFHDRERDRYRAFDMFSTREGIWATRVTGVDLAPFESLLVSAEVESNRTRPRGIVVASGNFAQARAMETDEESE